MIISRICCMLMVQCYRLVRINGIFINDPLMSCIIGYQLHIFFLHSDDGKISPSEKFHLFICKQSCTPSFYKPTCNITFTAAVFSIFITVYLECLSTVFALTFIYCFFINQLQMAIPPHISTFI